jgi:colanic acid/amylovoran biosynthesis glycosyltransferase
MAAIPGVIRPPDRTGRVRPLAVPPDPLLFDDMKIAYLFNTYPQPSTTALRREVIALEKMGILIHRFTLRQFDGDLVDEEDRAERERSRVVLAVGASGLAAAMLRAMAARPRAFARALSMAVKAGRVSERGLFRNLIYLAEACVLLRWLAALGIEHVHSHYGTNAAMVAMLCRVLGGPPYSFTMHGPEEFDSPRALGLREKIREAKFVVAITEFTRSQLYRWADYADWPKIRVVRVGVSAMFLEHGAEPIPAAPRLVNIGRIVEQKGQAILVQAAAVLRDRGHDFELVIVGDGPMRGEIERLIDQFELRDRVRITGYMSNQGVLRELRDARALVLPSFAEGLPGVFFEAMALGRPVISTHIAAHSELVEPGINGWLVPAGAVEPLVAAMAAALTADPAELEAMGRAGAAQVAERHNVDVEVRKLADLIAGPAAIAGREPEARVASAMAAR